jgi:O-antigen/teichoic acid export membrane protein
MVMFITFAVMSIVNYAFGLSMGWLLGPGDFGLLAFSQTILTVTGLVLNSGFTWSLSAALVGADLEHRAKMIRGAVLANLLLALGLGLSILLLFGFGPLKAGLETWPAAIVVAATMPMISIVTTIRAALQGSERFGPMASLLVFEVVGKAIAGIGLVFLGLGATGAITGFLIGSLLASLAGWVFLNRHLGISPFGAWQKPSFTRAGVIFTAIVGMALLLNLDILALKLFSQAGRDEVGHYQAGIILANAPYYLMTALFPVIFTQIVRKKTIPASTGLVGETFRLALLVLLPIELMLALFPEMFLRLLFPDEYLAGAPLLSILALGNAAIILVTVLSITFQAVGKAGLVGKILLSVAFLEAVLFPIIVPRWSGFGAAAIFAAATLTSLVLLGSQYLREVEKSSIHAALRWLGKYLLAVILGATAGGIVFFFTRQNWLSAGLGSVIYLTALFKFRLVSVRSIIQQLMGHQVQEQMEEK